ncbi:MAG TPA: Fis family transcriptional regulator [Thermoanaerobaculia bacterium]|jgi:putative sterol carrier protein|nr:Fis family transcriptional regulator [Thermoanaerobaculia bacterium]
MSYEMFTHDWAVACGDQIRANEEYRKAARNWRWPVVLTMKADAKLGLPERSVFLDLFEGDCREARVARAADLGAVPYIISADPSTWKRVLERDLEPIPGLMRGKLKLVKGSLVSLLPYVNAAKEMVAAAANVDTRFPSGL